MSGDHVPAVHSHFLAESHEAVCSCDWRSEDSDGVAVRYRTSAHALAAAQRHARTAASSAAGSQPTGETK